MRKDRKQDSVMICIGRSRIASEVVSQSGVDPEIAKHNFESSEMITLHDQ